MAVKDQEKTAFITPFGAFCYVSMPFGLKSAQATYQRCVQNCLHDQIGRNVHAYVDDIVVKSRKKETMIDDLNEPFDNLRVYKMILNQAKCVLRKHKHRVSQPLWMKNFNNEPGRQEPDHLLTNGLTPLLIEPPKKLLDRLKLWINIESVLSEFSRYTRHVRRFPCKDVPVLTYELDERTFLFGIQVSVDAELLG